MKRIGKSKKKSDWVAIGSEATTSKRTSVFDDLVVEEVANGKPVEGHYTAHEYSKLDRAYEFFNERLFDGSLPSVLMTYRKAGRFGLFVPGQFTERGGQTKAPELKLDPDQFVGRTDEQILAQLAVGMVDGWQKVHGAPSRKGYYNQEWCEKMQAIGLPTSGAGQKVVYSIEQGGLFETTAQDLIASGFKFRWQSPEGKQSKKEKKPPSKVKYSCRKCELNAWAKPEAPLVCGQCGLEMLMPEDEREPRQWTPPIDESKQPPVETQAVVKKKARPVEAPLETNLHIKKMAREVLRKMREKHNDDSKGPLLVHHVRVYKTKKYPDACSALLTQEELDCAASKWDQVTCPQCLAERSKRK